MYKLLRCEEGRDKNEMCQWISDQFQDPFDEVMSFLEELSINWGMSVKALDEDGKTVAFLTMSDYRIEEETEKIKVENPRLLEELNKLNYISGFSFIISPQHRNFVLSKQIFKEIMSDLMKYDFVFVPVRHELKTHNYWKHFGGICFYEDDESKFYAIPFNDKVKKIIDTYANTEKTVPCAEMALS